MKRDVLLPLAIAALSASAALAQPAPASSPSFGTTNTSYLSLGPSDFNPLRDTDPFERGYYLTTTGGSQSFFATPHLPGGALLTSLELQYCDTNGAGLHVYLEADDCLSVASPCDTPTILGFVQSTNDGCSSVSLDVSGHGYTIDNKNRKLILYVALNAPNTTSMLTGAVLGYRLQVSPPSGQTFTDVPPSNPFYQYIEALAASGITGGCGGGNFCPNNPVTRAQMATFLAKALGLSYSQ